MRLKLRHLDVFNALYDAGSVSRAAQRLNLSQPAVSVALGNLEAELGFRLFHRDRGFFAPTNEAALLHQDVQRGVAAMARLEQRAEEVRTGSMGRISVATNGVLAFNLLPALIAQFRRDHPGTHIDIRVHSSRDIASFVGNRQIDLGFIDVPVPVAGLQAERFRFECVCIFRRDDALAARDVIRPQDLEGRSVIAVTGDHAVDRQLRRVMSDAGTGLEQNVSSSYFAIARNLVSAGDNVAIVDPLNGKATLKDGVIWRPFAPMILHELAMITHRDQPLSITAERFRDRVRERLDVHQIAGSGPAPAAP